MKVDTNKNSSSAKRNTWLLVSGLFFLISFLLSLVLILFGKQLEFLGIVGNIYYIILIPLGFSSAAFLAGAMKSYASFQSNGTMPYGKLQLTGPIVIFALVVGGGYIMPNLNKKDTFPVKVRIVSNTQATNMFNKGRIFLYIGQERKSADIHDGEAKFENIPEAFKNKKVRILTDIDNFQLADSNDVLLPGNENYIDITVVRTKESLATLVRGSIMSKDNMPVKDALINFGSGLATGLTDENGDYAILVPLPTGEKVQLKVTVNRIIRFNEAVTLSQTTPLDIIVKL